jgi:hypothetical protein
MRLILPDIPVGLNGSKGLLRMHHVKRSKYNAYWKHLVRSAIDNSHKTPKGKQVVYVSQIRRRLLDPDNLAASCKPILDALVAWKIIKDDSTKHIELIPLQTSGKAKTTIVLIEPWTLDRKAQ